MENLNIRLYKDGDDLIVVYKGGAKDIDEISRKILSPLNSQQVPVKEIPDLIPVVEPEEKPITVKEAEDKYESFYPAFTEEDDEEVKEEAVEEKIQRENNTSNKNDEVANFNPEEILQKDGFKGFIKFLNDVKSNAISNEIRDLTIKALKTYYLANKDKIKDSNRAIDNEQLKKMIRISYNLFKEEMDLQLSKKGFANLDMALTAMSQFDVRGFYWNQVSNNIDKIMKSL